MRYYVVGVNGCGKTSLLTKIHAQTGYKVVHGTQALMDFLGISGDYQALRALDQTELLAAYGKMAGKLAATYAAHDLLLDTHIMNLTHGQMIDRSGDWIKQYDALVLVNAPTADILTRIEADSRDRALFPADATAAQKRALLKDYQQRTRQLFDSLAQRYKLPSVVLQNKQGGLQTAANAFLAFDHTLHTH